MTNAGKSLSQKYKALNYIQGIFPIVYLWILFRTITTIIAAVASSIRPITEIEQRIAIWPPTTPVSDWLERVLISPLYRWDVEWYTRIILNGYSNNDGTANFHPLYPWLAKLLSTFNLDPVFSLLIVSSIATIFLLVLLKNLIALDLNLDQTNLALFIFLLFPMSFILFAPYPESLFLLFSILCIYYLRKNKWGNAGISAFLAVLTRQQGIFLVFPFIWELWNASGKNLHKIRSSWRSWFTIALIPLAYLFWIGYRLFIISDGTIYTNDIHSAIYSIFISSSAIKVVPVQYFLWPWESLFYGLSKLLIDPDIDIWTNFITAIFFFILLVIGWKRLRTSYKIYSIIITLVSLSYYTGPIHPFMGLPRHLYLAFPFVIGIMPTFYFRKGIRLLYVTFGATIYTVLIILFTWHAWIP